MSRHWSTPYLGLPWRAGGRGRQGCDCWGLVRLVYDAELAIRLPSFNGSYSTAPNRESRLSLQEHCRRVAGNGDWTRVDDAKPFDLYLFDGGDLHVGLHATGRMMLHVEQGGESVLEDVTATRWGAPGRLVGIYRHRQMPEAA